MFLEAAGCVIGGGVVCLRDTTGMSRDLSLGDTTGVSPDLSLGDTTGVSPDVCLGATTGVSRDVCMGDTSGVSREVCVSDTLGVSRDMCEADRPSRPLSSYVVGVSRDESTKYDMLATSVIYINKETAKFLYSAVSNLQDCSKCFTLYFLADLFNQTPSEPLRVASSDTAINSSTALY